MLIQNTTSSVVTSPAPPRLPSNGGASGVAGLAGSERVVASESVARPPTASQLNSEVGKINAALQNANKNLELSISVDKATNKQVVKLMDKATGDTLLQYPSEAVLATHRGSNDSRMASC